MLFVRSARSIGNTEYYTQICAFVNTFFQVFSTFFDLPDFTCAAAAFRIHFLHSKSKKQKNLPEIREGHSSVLSLAFGIYPIFNIGQPRASRAFLLLRHLIQAQTSAQATSTPNSAPALSIPTSTMLPDRSDTQS